LKCRSVFYLIACLSLQACQQSEIARDEQRVKKKHLNDASGYNIQLGLGYLKQGNIPRSKRKLLLALEQAPNSAEANAAMGYFLEKTSDVEHAKSYYQKAMIVAPGKGAQLNNYGAFLCRQGEYKEAEGYFLKAVADIQYEHTAGAYENAGLCALEVPDEAKAITYFNQALAQDPSSIQSLQELVKLHMKQGRYAEALAQLQKYPEIVLRSRPLLASAVKSAHETGQTVLEANYRRSLEISGVNQDDNHDNG
jgi:type IV pilus assembly protein PilF